MPDTIPTVPTGGAASSPKPAFGLPDTLTWVRLTFVDVFGGGHSLQIPARLFRGAVEKGHPFDGSALEGRARLAEKDMRLRPDPATLHRVVDDLEELAADYTAGAEVEFYFLDGTRPID